MADEKKKKGGCLKTVIAAVIVLVVIGAVLGGGNDADKAADSRFIHRGDFDWEKAEQRRVPGTVAQQIFDGLLRLEAARRSSPAFDSDADFWTLDTGDDGVLGIGRWKDGACVLALFNFAGSGKTARIRETGWWKDLITGEERETDAVQLPPYGYAMLELVHL